MMYGLFGTNYRELLHYCFGNYHSSIEIDRTILTCLNEQKELFITDGPTLNIEKLLIKTLQGAFPYILIGNK